jgi:RelA/SpoT family (p)ppGpp synthetase
MNKEIVKNKKISQDWNNYLVGSNADKDIELLIYECSNKFSSFNEDLVRKAYRFCFNAHKRQIRMSGQPYYTHSLEVARIIANELPMDDVSVAAALLHDVPDDSEYTLEDIRLEFGDEIAGIVDGIIQIQQIEKFGVQKVENYRKLLIAWFNDVRIILIKLADRLHNMRTIEFLSDERQTKLAKETLEIYSPFAHRFGLGIFKWELEDLAFKTLNREEYDKISKTIQLTRQERKDYISAFIEPIKERLDSNDLLTLRQIKFDISGRPKHIYSIYNKTIIRDKPIEELYDLFAVRIILDTEDIATCYIVLGIISEIYKPVPGTFKDYIADTKKNGYQSIHLAVIGMDHRPVEVQIRTRKMHDYAESGFAAHFKYKRGYVPNESVLDSDNLEEWVDAVRGIFENHTAAGSELFQSVKSNFLLDDITVFTPSRECKNLPIDSTPLDYAYAVHTDVGNSCIGAKVNGKIAPLNYKLKNGDQVEILTSSNQKPVKEWLKYVVSQKAKSAIVQYLRNEQKRYRSIGEDKWIALQTDFAVLLTDEDFKAIISKLKYENEDEFFMALGKNDIDIDYIHNCFYHKLKENKKNEMARIDEETDFVIDQNFNSKLNLNVPIFYSECCYPIPGDRVVGEVIEGKGLYVHRRSCKKVAKKLNPPEPNIITLNWEWLHKEEYLMKFYILAEASDSLLSEITGLILQSNNIQIRGITFNNDEDKFEGFITISIKTGDDMEALFEKIKNLVGVKKLERAMN